MLTEMDEGKGLVKVYWSDIRKRVSKVEPAFTKIVDELSPDKTFPIFLAYYPYGAFKGDTQSTFLPKEDKSYYRLSDPNGPKEVLKHLCYGKDSSPMGMVLEKELEYFIDLPKEGISIPWLIYSPGSFFPFSTILSKSNTRTYAPNGVLTVTSGARSTFLLPNIGCTTNHINLQREFNVQAPTAKLLYEHWRIFREIVNSDVINCSWRSCVMFFAEKWIDKLHNDKSWLKLKTYLLELAWHRFEYERNRIYYDISFSLIQNKRNLKPNPYLADTARHLFVTALGAAPGFIPAHNENAMPLELLQKVFLESYGLKKYFPTIMQPIHFNFEQDKFPIYYSLQHPSTHVFSPKSRKISSTLFEMRELEHIMRVFIEELTRKDGMCSDTVISKIAREIEFNYYHNKIDRHRVVKYSSDIIKKDKKFNSENPKYKSEKFTFPSDAPFVRGCISIQTKS